MENTSDLVMLRLLLICLKMNNKTVRVLKTPKTESSARKVFIPRSVAQYLIELKQE